MGIENGELKRKHSLGMELSGERKSSKVSIQAVPTKSFVSHGQGLELTNSGAEEKPCLRKCSLVIKYSRKRKDDEKCGPGNNGSSQSEIRSSNQIDDSTPSKKFTGIEKSTCIDMEQKDRETCLAPTSISEPHAVFEGTVRHDPAFDSEEKNLPEKTVQDKKVPKKEMTDILNNEAAQDEQLPEQKRTKISRSEVAQEEFRKSLRARAFELNEETSRLTNELQRRSTMCVQITKENKLLMNKLKKICEPSVIKVLEAKNPATG